MRAGYDFTDSKPNPYAKRLRRPVTMRIDVEAIDYFKEVAARMGIPYQNLINLYLVQCTEEKKGPRVRQEHTYEEIAREFA